MNIATDAKGKVEFLLKALGGLGYKRVGVLDIPNGEALEYLNERSNITIFRLSHGGLSADSRTTANVSIPEFIAEAARRKLTAPIALNAEYTAVILDKDTVKVGCQTFSTDKVLEVAEAIKELQK